MVPEDYEMHEVLDSALTSLQKIGRGLFELAAAVDRNAQYTAESNEMVAEAIKDSGEMVAEAIKGVADKS